MNTLRVLPIAIAAAASISISIFASVPVARAEDPVVKPTADITTLANADFPQTIKLTNSFEIPDGPNGQINLPLYCAADFAVRIAEGEYLG